MTMSKLVLASLCVVALISEGVAQLSGSQYMFGHTTGVTADADKPYRMYRLPIYVHQSNISYDLDTQDALSEDPGMCLSAEWRLVFNLSDPTTLTGSEGSILAGNSQTINVQSPSLGTDAMIVAKCSDRYMLLKVEPITFSVEVGKCVDDIFTATVTVTHLTDVAPVMGEVSILDQTDSNCSTSFTSNPVVFDMVKCGVNYDLPNYVLVSYDQIVSNDNTFMYEVVCSKSTDNVITDTDTVTEIAIVTDASQDMFDEALLLEMRMLNSSGSPISQAVIGDEVTLEIKLDTLFRQDFDIKPLQCFVDNILVYDTCSINSLVFEEFVKPEAGVLTSDFKLFKGDRSSKTSVVNFGCVVETCIDACPLPDCSASRKRRSADEDRKREHYIGGVIVCRK